MKKQVLILAGSALLLASCGSNTNTPQQTQEHIIDSTVNAKLAQRMAENAAKNDSTLNAMEKEKAAAMEKERGAGGNNTTTPHNDSLKNNANQ